MGTKKKFSPVLLFFIWHLLSCDQRTPEHEHEKGEVRYRKHLDGLQKEVFDSNQKLLSKQFFDKDTIPFGALEEYYDNGKLAKWKWFNRSYSFKSGDSIAFYTHGGNTPIQREEQKKDDIHAYPDCIAYYDTLGQLDTFVGKPFIAIRLDTFGKTWMNIVQPPNTNAKIMYIDEVDNEVVKCAFYNPIYCSDTGCWVGLNEYRREKGHKYELDYLFCNSKNETLFLVKGKLK